MGLVLALAGCGSSASTGTSADPAGAVPASAPLYVGAVVRPSGSLKDEALAAGQALTRQHNPYSRLLGVLQTPGSPTLDYGRDIAPWLGPGGGLFVTSLGSGEALTGLLQQGLTGSGTVGWPFGAGGAQGAIVLDTSDLSKAQAFVSAQAAHAGAHAQSLDGVSYEAGSGAAFALVDKLVVIGSESGVRAVIETSKGASSPLVSDPTYAQLQAHAPAGALGHLYANPSAAAATTGKASAQATGTAGAAGAEQGVMGVLSSGRPINVSLVPSAKSLTLDADIGPTPAGSSGGARGTAGTGSGGSGSGSGGLLGALATGNHALGELPGEAWLAAGLGKVGSQLGGSVGGLSQLLALVNTLSSAGVQAPPAQATLSVKGIVEGFSVPLRVLSANTAQARRDYLSWMGEAGMFVAGTTVLELKAAAVIDSTNPAASRAAVGKLAAALRSSGAEATPATIPGTEAAIEAKVAGLPITLVIADGRASNGQTKFVMGLAESSIQAALNPPSKIADTSAYSTAEKALGEGIQPSLIVNPGALLTLLEGVGLSEDPTIAPFVPYLRDSTEIAGGGKDLGGGVQRLRIVLGLAPAPH